MLLGSGRRLFNRQTVPATMKLVTSRTLPNGVVLSVYRRAGSLTTGNVILKTTEGIAEAMFDLIRQEISATMTRQLLARLLKPAFKAIQKRTDWAEYGGAPLLGVDGVAVLCHGRSSARAIENAITMAADLADVDMRPTMTEAIARHSALYAPRPAAAAAAAPHEKEGEEGSA